MKKLLILSILLVLIGSGVFVVYAYNRDTSIAMYEINTTYGSKYNPPELIALDQTGTDGDGPLYTTAHAWQGFTDDGITIRRSYREVVTDRKTPKPITNSGRQAGGWGLLPHEIDYEVYKDRDGDLIGYWTWPKDYKKKFAMTAWAYVSCGESYKQYKTKYKLEVSVPEGFHVPNKRNPPEQTEYGAFHDQEYIPGVKDGWDFVLDSSSITARSNAEGYHPSKDESHASSADAPGSAHAHHCYYYCGVCGSEKKGDMGCSTCADYIDSRTD